MRIGKVSIGRRRLAALVALATIVMAPAIVLIGVDAWLVTTVALGIMVLLVAGTLLVDLRQLRRAVAVGQRPPRGLLRQLVKTQRRAAVRGLQPLRRVARFLGIGNSADAARRQLNQEIRSVSHALWLGFTTDAVAELERIRRVGEDPGIAMRAAETLARWYATERRHQLALDRLIHARDIDRDRNVPRLRVLEHHLLAQLDLFDEAELLFERWGAQSPDLHLVQANLRLRQAETGRLPREAADRQRLELIDWVFRRHSLTPISQLVDDAAPLEFAALRGGAVPTTPRPGGKPPVVSIVVPAYNAESTLTTSVNSLRAQSVRDIEILIVDDASTDNTSAVAKTLASDDPRVRVIRHEHNQGAYQARNTGLMNASGEFFTVHDADDWSHPQLLERQLRVLDAPHATASFSRLARITPQFEFLLRPYRPMLEPIHWNYTSLLARTQLLRDLGGWDTVRAHADAELIERMRDHFGKDTLVEADTEVPLSFFLVTGTNITERKDTGLRSVDFGARKEYSEQARFWRRKTFGDGELPSLREHRRTDAKSPFFCVRSLATNRDKISQSFDLLIGSDLSLLGGTRRCNLAYIDCARRLGLRVGIFNTPRYRTRASGTIDPAYRELFQLPDVDLVTPEADVTARALLVHHPPVLRKAFDSYPSIRADRQYLLVNQLPWQMKGYQEVQYDTDVVHRHFAESFGHDPAWIPISKRVRRYLVDHVPAGALLDEDWYPIVGETAPSPRVRSERTATMPVVGRHSRDHATKWPESGDVLAKSYLAESDYEVRLLGGTKAAEEVLGRRPKNWQVYPFDSLPVDEFLQGIDIFVHFHHSMYIEEFGRNVAEAMAMGVPCVLPTEYEETFGDAAFYAEPDQVADAIRTLWSDHDMYDNHSERGIAFVAENCGWEAGTRRIASLLG
jgi:glycosyltransferase involved in cell wall biosynthesis